jgi:hypothetical protein
MWRSSSYSDSNGNCVQVRGDLAAVRDSKHSETVMPVSRAALDHLVASIRQRADEPEMS